MGTAVHDATGRKCSRCGKEFSKSSWTGRITEKEGGFIVHKIVCIKCHHHHHSKGE